MNKRPFLAILVATVLCVSGVFVACSTDDKSADGNKVVLDDTVVMYINLDQLGDKSAINEIITDSNRSLLATLLTAECDNAEWTEYTEKLLADLGKSGLDTKTPIYGYFDVKDACYDEGEYVLVAKVADINAVDRFVKYFSEMSGENIEVVKEGNTRKFELDDIYLAYNAERFVAVASNKYVGDVDSLLERALERPDADLSAYAKYDCAASINLDEVVALQCQNMQIEIDEAYEYLDVEIEEWEYEWVMYEIQQMEEELETLKTLQDYIEKDARATLGLSFKAGRVVAELSTDGVKSEYKLDCKVSNDHLAYVNEDVLAVLNLGVNGEMMSQILTDKVTPDYADMLGLSRNEFNIYFGILCDAIKSINGDVTLALHDIYGGYNVEGVDAILAMDVEDDYIVSNVAQFGEGILNNYGNNTYGLTYAGVNFKLGQEDTTLFATINDEFKKQTNSATKRAWATDLKGSYGYIVMDIDNMMDNRYVSYLYRKEMKSFDSTTAGYINNFVDSCSYAYININTPTSVQLVLVFDDRETNSLEQIVRQVVPMVIREATKGMF